MLLLALLLVPVLVSRPFAMVGVETSRGVAYRQYFTADHVWRRTVVAELAKGDFLPKNPYYIDDPLHYYWLPHLLDAVVQVDTQTRAANMWAFIPAFAERCMAVGLPLSMVPLMKYQVGAGRIHRLYHADSAATAYELAVRFGIDYLVVGPPERLAHHGIEARWGTTPDLLPLVFRNDALSIFSVRPPRE